MAEVLTSEKLEKAINKAVSKMPQNVIKSNIALIDKGIEAGLTFKQIAELLDEEFEVKIKPSQIKKAYFEAKADGGLKQANLPGTDAKPAEKSEAETVKNQGVNPVQKQTFQAQKQTGMTENK